MKKKKICIILCIVLALMLSGCKEEKLIGPFIYYVNTKGTGLVKVKYNDIPDNTDKDIAKMLRELKNAPESIEYKAAIPKGVKVVKQEMDRNKLRVYFDNGYNDLSAVEELLLRSAVVQTLAQNSAVQFVEFYVDSEGLKDKDGYLVGPMRSDDFIQNTGSEINSYQADTLELYFSNKSGNKLVKETVNVRYNSNMSVEKLVVEQLMKGPAGDEAVKTIPPETKLIGVSVKDSICYVNFDEGFLNNTFDLDPKIPIYSIVDSIIKNGTANKVQISISGETNVTFKGSVKLDAPFSSDMELVEDKK